MTHEERTQVALNIGVIRKKIEFETTRVIDDLVPLTEDLDVEMAEQVVNNKNLFDAFMDATVCFKNLKFLI